MSNKKKGRFGCIGCLGVLLILFVLLPLVFGPKRPDVEPQVVKPEWPLETASLKFIEAGRDSSPLRSQMDLYEIVGNLKDDELIQVCKKKKELFTDNRPCMIAFFDSRENAKFPTVPFTAGFQADEQTAKHVKAYFYYDKRNGSTSLEAAEPNIWEGKRRAIEIQ